MTEAAPRYSMIEHETTSLPFPANARYTLALQSLTILYLNQPTMVLLAWSQQALLQCTATIHLRKLLL